MSLKDAIAKRDWKRIAEEERKLVAQSTSAVLLTARFNQVPGKSIVNIEYLSSSGRSLGIDHYDSDSMNWVNSQVYDELPVYVKNSVTDVLHKNFPLLGQ